MDNIKTRAVKNKNVAMKLANEGFEILNITQSRDDAKSFVYIFQDIPEFRVAFDALLKTLPKAKDNKDCYLTHAEKKYLLELLESKQLEYQKMGVKTDTIDGIIQKLKAKDSLKASTQSKYAWLKEDNLVLKQDAAKKLLDHVNATDYISKTITDSITRNCAPVNLNYPWIKK